MTARRVFRVLGYLLAAIDAVVLGSAIVRDHVAARREEGPWPSSF